MVVDPFETSVGSLGLGDDFSSDEVVTNEEESAVELLGRRLRTEASPENKTKKKVNFLRKKKMQESTS